MLFPEKAGIYLLVENKWSSVLIDFFVTYFQNKKKTKGIAYYDSEDVISTQEYEFIYIPNTTQLFDYFDFKQKTLFNTEISSIINENPEKFTSIERIRKDLENLFTDSGMFELKNILEKDTDLRISFDKYNFEVNKLIQNIRINYDALSMNDLFKISYNLLLFLNRKKKKIVYVDFYLDEDSFNWLNSKKDNNSIVIVNNSFCSKSIVNSFDYMLIINNSEDMQIVNRNNKEASLLSYLFYPYILENREFQLEKNIEILDYFDNNLSTFLIRFVSQNMS